MAFNLVFKLQTLLLHTQPESASPANQKNTDLPLPSSEQSPENNGCRVGRDDTTNIIIPRYRKSFL